MFVTDIMTEKVVTVHMDSSIKNLRRKFIDVKFHHVLVEDNYKLVGVVSDRDLLKELSPDIDTKYETEKDLSRLKRKVHQIMSKKPMTITEHTSIVEAGKLLLEAGFSCLPVVDESMKIKGIVTWKDILKHYVNS